MRYFNIQQTTNSFLLNYFAKVRKQVETRNRNMYIIKHLFEFIFV